MNFLQSSQIQNHCSRLTFSNVVCRGLLFCCFWGIWQSGVGQEYKVFRQKIQQQTKLYREDIPCEKAVKDKLGKLADLMQLTPDKSEIVRSCKFIRGMNGGCPQTTLKDLLLTIQKAYATTANDTIFVANGQDALEIAEKNIFDSGEKVEAEQTKEEVPFNTYLMYFSLISLSFLCAYLLIKLNQLQKAHLHTHKIISTPKSQPNTIMNDEILERLTKEIATLKDENARLRQEFGRVKAQMNGLQELCEEINSKINAMEKERNATEMPASHAAESRVVSNSVENKPPVPVVETQPYVIQTQTTYPQTTYTDKKYALYMDNSEGFSIQGLMPYSGSDTIYELLLQNERTANYRVFDNHDAHQYALSDPSYYLRTACEYENSPASGRRIETVSEGLLENTGSIWKIVRKAKIRFI